MILTRRFHHNALHVIEEQVVGDTPDHGRLAIRTFEYHYLRVYVLCTCICACCCACVCAFICLLCMHVCVTWA